MSWFGFDKYRIQNANPNHLNIFFFSGDMQKKEPAGKRAPFRVMKLSDLA